MLRDWPEDFNSECRLDKATPTWSGSYLRALNSLRCPDIYPGTPMPNFEVRVICTKGDEHYTDDTERMAVLTFCEVMEQDATLNKPHFPVGTEIVLNDLERRKTLLRYVVGYE